MKYNYLRKQYPEYVSINQFHQICHIAKRTAQYLLKKGIVPYIDTGKKTWKYKIALDDVIAYLEFREKEGSQIPRGALNNKRKYRKSEKKSITFSTKVQEDGKLLVQKFFRSLLAEYPDVFTISEVGQFTGFDTATIRKRIKEGDLDAIRYENKYLIPKKHLLWFLSSDVFLDMRSPSDRFYELLDEYEAWKAGS